MAQPTLIFEASKNPQGDYECHTVSEEIHSRSNAKTGAESHVNSGTENQWAEFAGNESDDVQSGQSYYIDPNIVHSAPPNWAVQANELFEQGLRSNSQGGYTDYLTQMREQFEQMRQTLQEQMNQRNHNGY